MCTGDKTMEPNWVIRLRL